MRLFRWTLSPLCLALVSFGTQARAFASSDWLQPTADELKMTSYAPDPDAPAVFLFFEQTVDMDKHTFYEYARIKILTEKGKEMFSDVELPYVSRSLPIKEVEGRTIHSDGATFALTGKPYDKLLIKARGVRIMSKVFTMPDVEVGSIVEYRFKLEHWDYPPQWVIQQSVPVLKAYYYFRPGPGSEIVYSGRLPGGDGVVKEKNGSFDFSIEHVPAIPDEDYLPPLRDLSYRVNFFYSSAKSDEEYWKTEGDEWFKGYDHFAQVTGKIRDAANGIFAPGDTEEQKVQKIYAAVMKLENTSFTRERSAREDKAEHLKEKSVQDIWTQQRGTDWEITLLFVALVRAAGLKAYSAIVVDRDKNAFDPDYLNWQFNGTLAIVSINGKEVFFDPGERYCEFGKLHWKHTWAGGIRQTDHKTQIFTTPGPSYLDNTVTRAGQLTLDSDGHVNGRIYLNMTGATALLWREAALLEDEVEAKKEFEEELQHSMAPGVQVKMNHFVSLADYTTPLMAILDVSGTLGTQTGKHVIMPAVFFDAGNGPLFSETQRKEPVDLRYPYIVQDQVDLTLPPNITVDSLPLASSVSFIPNADYVTKFATPKGNVFEYKRRLRVANFLYKVDEYPALRNFYQKLSADDQEQVALKLTPVTASIAPTVAKNPEPGK